MYHFKAFLSHFHVALGSREPVVLFSGWNKKTKAGCVCVCVRGAFSGRVLPDLASHCTTGPSGFFVSYSNLSPSLFPSPGPYTWESFRAESIAYKGKIMEHVTGPEKGLF